MGSKDTLEQEVEFLLALEAHFSSMKVRFDSLQQEFALASEYLCTTDMKVNYYEYLDYHLFQWIGEKLEKCSKEIEASFLPLIREIRERVEQECRNYKSPLAIAAGFVLQAIAAAHTNSGRKK